tara:strand:- start:545 stop:1165 length:621 start_codon:yes stop_codon:yes gene_type:complete
LRPQTIADIQYWGLHGIWPYENEGAQELIEMFKKNTASRPHMMEKISVSMTGIHYDDIHGNDGTLDPSKKGPSSKIEFKGESYSKEKLMGRQSWGIEKTEKLTREENIQKKMSSFGVIQIGSYTEDFRIVALFDMPIEDTTIEKDLITKAKNSSKSLKLSYTSLDTPKAIENSFINCIDLKLAEHYTTEGYFEFLKKLNKGSKNNE